MRIETHSVSEYNVLADRRERSDVTALSDSRAVGDDGGIVNKGFRRHY
jgi:hypothetical protein